MSVNILIPVHQRQWQKVQGCCCVQPTVQHDGGGFKLEHITGQSGMTWQTVLKHTHKYAHDHVQNMERVIYSRRDSIWRLNCSWFNTNNRDLIYHTFVLTNHTDIRTNFMSGLQKLNWFSSFVVFCDSTSR